MPGRVSTSISRIASIGAADWPPAASSPLSVSSPVNGSVSATRVNRSASIFVTQPALSATPATIAAFTQACDHG